MVKVVSSLYTYHRRGHCLDRKRKTLGLRIAIKRTMRIISETSLKGRRVRTLGGSYGIHVCRNGGLVEGCSS